MPTTKPTKLRVKNQRPWLFEWILINNATIILLIYGVVLITSKKYDYPPLMRNVSWFGLLSIAHLGGSVWEDEGSKQLLRWTPNLVWDWIARNHNKVLSTFCRKDNCMHRDKVIILFLIKRRGQKAHGLKCYSRANIPPDTIVTNKKSCTWICKYVVVKMPQNIGCIKNKNRKKKKAKTTQPTKFFT